MSKEGRGEEIDTLVVLNHNDDDDNAVSLYSMRDDTWSELPRFPKSRKTQKGIPDECQCVSLDGKIYILGGLKGFREDDSDYEEEEEEEDDDDDAEQSKKKMKVTDGDDDGKESREVYVLDLSGNKREWKQCANMPQPRDSFGCCVLEGKIYVIGGYMSGKPTNESLVYDTKENAWSSIKPMKNARYNHHVVAVGEELFVHGGVGLKRKESLVTEVYHAGKDEWRSLEPFDCHKSERLFAAQGKLHMITPLGIYGHEIDGDGNYSWALERLFGFGEDYLDDDEVTEVTAVQAVNDELLALLTWSDPRESQTVFHRSRGFGTDKKEFLWDVISCEILAFNQFASIMCPVQA